jgi:hypothetical protein
MLLRKNRRLNHIQGDNPAPIAESSQDLQCVRATTLGMGLQLRHLPHRLPGDNLEKSCARGCFLPI